MDDSLLDLDSSHVYDDGYTDPSTFMTRDGSGGIIPTEDINPITPGQIIPVTGRCVDQYGNAIAGARVAAQLGPDVTTGTSGNDGSFVLNVPAQGHYIVSASSQFFDFAPVGYDTSAGTPVTLTGVYNYSLGDASPRHPPLGPPLQNPVVEFTPPVTETFTGGIPQTADGLMTANSGSTGTGLLATIENKVKNLTPTEWLLIGGAAFVLFGGLSSLGGSQAAAPRRSGKSSGGFLD